MKLLTFIYGALAVTNAAVTPASAAPVNNAAFDAAVTEVSSNAPSQNTPSDETLRITSPSTLPMTCRRLARSPRPSAPAGS